jgi:hypothetical protein
MLSAIGWHGRAMPLRLPRFAALIRVTAGRARCTSFCESNEIAACEEF